MEKQVPEYKPSFKSLVRTNYKGGYKLEVFKGVIGFLHWRLTNGEKLIDSGVEISDFVTPIGDIIHKDEIEKHHSLVKEK